MKKIDIKDFFEKASQNYIMQRYSRCLNGTLKLDFENEAWLITFVNGKYTNAEIVSADTESDLFVIASEEQWEKMLEVFPPAFYNTFANANMYHGIKCSSGILQLQYDAYMSEMLRELRSYYNGLPLIDEDPAPVSPNVRTEEIVGRYVYITVDGIEYRVYYEESGQGIPFILQHTAGANAAEYRYLMNDPEYTKDFRFIALDLPYHGKSLPPESYPWWNHRYQLSLDWLLKFYDAFTDALKLDRPAYMGCSMGGHLAPDLAYYRPEKFRACVGIGAALATATEASAGDRFDDLGFVFDNPQVNNLGLGSGNESIVALPPYSTPNSMREVGWDYACGGPGVFGGDLYYYNIDHNLIGKAQDIDTNKCMLYIMAGTYDPGTPPATCQALKDAVEGSKLIFMEGLGHYAMLEAYPSFKTYFTPVADEIKTLK